MLLKTYGVDIPTPIGDEVDGEVDSVSLDILKRYQPVVLEDVYPARVAADGNCLYRAISKVICGNEALFILLRKRKINERSTTIKKQKTFSDDSE